MNSTSNTGSRFLRATSAPSSVRRYNDVVWEGPVARALSERHWVEEWAVLRRGALLFFGLRSKKASLSLGTTDVLSAQPLDPGEAPFQGYGFLAVATAGRVFHLCLPSSNDAEDWAIAVSRLVRGTSRPSFNSVKSIDLSLQGDAPVTSDPGDTFLHKSKLWQYGKRRLLNCRLPVYFNGAEEARRQQPCELVAAALQLGHSLLSEDGDTESLVSFLDAASALKGVRVDTLTQNEKWAFFINLYHLMIIHAQVVLGAPAGAIQWLSYYSMAAYQVADDILSLAELEHCVLRAGMSRPSPPTSTQLISKLVLPKSEYAFALRDGDYRLNFALNCGSFSNPPSVPIYRAETIDQQLDRACEQFLRGCVEISPKGKTAVMMLLPKICQWYSNDFGTQLDCARVIMPYLTREMQAALWEVVGAPGPASPERLVKMMDEGWMLTEGALTVKYLPYDFRCRPLSVTLS